MEKIARLESASNLRQKAVALISNLPIVVQYLDGTKWAVQAVQQPLLVTSACFTKDPESAIQNSASVHIAMMFKLWMWVW